MPFPLPRFAAFTTLLRALIARQGLAAGLRGATIVAIWQRARRAADQVEWVSQRMAAGTLRRHRNRRKPRPAARRPAPRALPGGRAWLVRLLPATAPCAAQLQTVIDDPAMPALLAAAPQLRRALRPLCAMLGARLPPAQDAPPPPSAPTSPPAQGAPPVRAAPPAPRRRSRPARPFIAACGRTRAARPQGTLPHPRRAPPARAPCRHTAFPA